MSNACFVLASMIFLSATNLVAQQALTSQDANGVAGRSVRVEGTQEALCGWAYRLEQGTDDLSGNEKLVAPKLTEFLK